MPTTTPITIPAIAPVERPSRREAESCESGGGPEVKVLVVSDDDVENGREDDAVEGADGSEASVRELARLKDADLEADDGLNELSSTVRLPHSEFRA